MTGPVLILGGYGVFGSRLSRALAARGYEIIIAGRRAQPANKLARDLGARAAVIDLDAPDLPARLSIFRPFAIIDAAGPWQVYGSAPYKVPAAAIACGAHYLDLSDDAQFTTGITHLDKAAREAGVAVLSGVSSVPALSAAAVRALTRENERLHLIDSAILPGNRAPRGRSVIASILSQAGRPLALWRGGQWTENRGWGDRTILSLEIDGHKPVPGRWASFIGAPDLTLFPEAFQARSVIFRAGLDLKLMHGGLGVLGTCVKAGWIRDLAGWTGLLKRCADLLVPFGSKRGGMRVRVICETADGSLVERSWTLIAEAGDGPNIPAIPAEILLGKLIENKVQPGARPCLLDLDLAEAEAALSRFDIHTGMRVRPAPTPFQLALATTFRDLSLPLKQLHLVTDHQEWTGTARIRRGTHPLSKLIGWLFGFPPAGEGILVHVLQTRTPTGERWVRQFGRHRFASHLSHPKAAGPGEIEERFGLFRFRLKLHWDGTALHFPVVGGRFAGVPLPKWALPQSTTREDTVGDTGTAFDVEIRLPLIGLLVHYRGELEPVTEVCPDLTTMWPATCKADCYESMDD